MSKGNLLDAGNGSKIQAFVLSKGYVNLETGTHTGVCGCHCVTSGNIVVTWLDATTDTIACLEGDQLFFRDITSLEVSTGKFHLMENE